MDRYDIARSYADNYATEPRLTTDQLATLKNRQADAGKHANSILFCGMELQSPLGISAGPLLNSKWVLHYADLGFQFLTYKTVRSQARECYPAPNLVPVPDEVDWAKLDSITAQDKMRQSWAISFGMPSQPPSVWRKDVELARTRLDSTKRLCVSVVASPNVGDTLAEIAVDYARCAKWAAESGADCVELNFSCPNVASCDGQLYLDSASAGLVAHEAKLAIGQLPLLIKIGHLTDPSDAEQLVGALEESANALVMVNCLQARVTNGPELMFDGQARGIGGLAIREACREQVELFDAAIRAKGSQLQIVGVGGISSPTDVNLMRRAGATTVQLATAAMLDPLIAIKWQAELATLANY